MKHLIKKFSTNINHSCVVYKAKVVNVFFFNTSFLCDKQQDQESTTWPTNETQNFLDRFKPVNVHIFGPL